MTGSVVFHRLARGDLFDIYDYVAERAGPRIAAGYLDRIEEACANLASFPNRGVDRSDLGPGVRTHALERRVLIAYRVSSREVEVMRVFYAGRDFGIDDLPR